MFLFPFLIIFYLIKNLTNYLSTLAWFDSPNDIRHINYNVCMVYSRDDIRYLIAILFVHLLYIHDNDDDH
jgi:hypothetical protein